MRYLVLAHSKYAYDDDAICRRKPRLSVHLNRSAATASIMGAQCLMHKVRGVLNQTCPGLMSIDPYIGLSEPARPLKGAA